MTKQEIVTEVNAQIGFEVRKRCYDQVFDPLTNAFKENVEPEVRLKINENVWGRIDASVWRPVRNQIMSQLFYE